MHRCWSCVAIHTNLPILECDWCNVEIKSRRITKHSPLKQIETAAEVMRRILVENARRKLRVRHGGDMTRVDLDEAELVAALPPDALLGLNDAIENLARHDRPAAD